MMSSPVTRATAPAHTGADCFLLDVLAEGGALLGELGVEGSGDVAHGILGTFITFEEHLLGVFTEEPAETAMHGLLFRATHILAEDTIAAMDQIAVDVQTIGQNDRFYVRFGVCSSPGYNISQICDMIRITSMKRAVLYMRVSSLDQHPETQLHDLRQMAAQRGYEIVQEYTDRISGAKARRPGLDDLLRDARRGRFDVILVWASDRIARSVKHFLELLDEFNRLNIEFISFREQIDTAGPLGRAIVVIIGAIAELERNLIIERVRAGMRRAKLEGRHIGRRPLELDREAIVRDRQRGQSLGQLAKDHCASRATIHRVLREHASTSQEPVA
jgi:DNA invertase Pin-like site-specific DNA recombinase